ncbi:MAG: DUF488 domain-containing protein, partial [Bacteroidetes bacterium]
MAETIYTIGHSNHPIEYFIEMLETCQINCVVDVRSHPSSRYNPQYNKGSLEAVLRRHDIRYLHFGREFGARQENRMVQKENGQVDFEKFRQTDAFRLGVQKLEEGLDKGFKIALMCSEANPLECHRFSMISVFLVEKGFRVLHILRDKTLATHADLESDLLKKYAKKLPRPSLFEPDISPQDQLRAAYELHNADIGWVARK